MPTKCFTPCALQTASNSATSVLSAGSSTLLIPEIIPTGSPRGDVSMSCCTQADATTTSPICRSFVSVPLTPELTSIVAPNFTIIVCAHTAANTLPTPHCASTTSCPMSVPRTKSMPLTRSVTGFSILALRSATSTSIAPMMPIMFYSLYLKSGLTRFSRTVR